MWDHPNPIFVDFETQSLAEIDETGGYIYAQHPSTRILMCSVIIDSTYHMWIPDYIKVDTSRWLPQSLWPNELTPHHPVRLYRGSVLPLEIQDQCEERPCVAHNAYGFDRYIWERFCKSRPQWLDSLYLARLSARSGRLDTLSKSILGIGKDRAKKLLPILTTAKVDMFGGLQYPSVKPGDLQAFARYAIADTELVRRLWHGELSTVPVEADVIRVHNDINARGVKVDVPLLRTIENVSRYSTEEAAKEVDRLTGGKIPPNKLRSTQTVHDWLESYGITITDESRLDKQGKPKLSLRKEVVQKYIDSPYLVESHLHSIKEIPPVVIKVLELRMKALRITDAKVKKAQKRVDKDGRIRDLISYAVAGTRRFSSNGVQIHNLPRGNKWLNSNLQKLVNIASTPCNDVRKTYNAIKEVLPDNSVTVDDVCSSLLRPSIVASKNKLLLIADWSQIEARGIAWIADEQKLLNLFAAHRDPYKELASKIFGVPYEQVTDDMRQVGKVGILGLGYGMADTKFRIFAANSGVDLVKAGVNATAVVDTYRDTYQKIAGWRPRNKATGELSHYRVGGVWRDLSKAVMDCVSTRQPHHVAKCYFHMQGKDLICVLPSGGQLYYPNARVEDVIPPYVWTMNLPPNPKATVVYDSNRGVKSLFGGLLAENIVQAISRDILATALVRFDKVNLHCIMHVHDEPVCEEDESKANSLLPVMINEMIRPIEWAPDFPLHAEGYVSPRFVKKKWEGYLGIDSKTF